MVSGLEDVRKPLSAITQSIEQTVSRFVKHISYRNEDRYSIVGSKTNLTFMEHLFFNQMNL